MQLKENVDDIDKPGWEILHRPLLTEVGSSPAPDVATAVLADASGRFLLVFPSIFHFWWEISWPRGMGLAHGSAVRLGRDCVRNSKCCHCLVGCLQHFIHSQLCLVSIIEASWHLTTLLSSLYYFLAFILLPWVLFKRINLLCLNGSRCFSLLSEIIFNKPALFSIALWS